MKFNLLIAPDFAPERFAGWHMLNTLLQKRTGLHLHLMTPANASEQADMINQGDVDIIYANPFDATHLIREKGYRVIARPKGKADEMVIATKADGALKTLDDVKAGMKVAMADNRDVKLIGLRLLEAVDLVENDLEFNVTENYQAAAREVIKGNADVAFFLSEVYHGLSRLTLSQLHVLIESDLSDITHVILINEKLAGKQELLQTVLSLTEDTDGQEVLAELGMKDGFEVMSEEDGEFMIDLMDTLLD